MIIKYCSFKDSSYVTRALFEKNSMKNQVILTSLLLWGFFSEVFDISTLLLFEKKNNHILALLAFHNKQHALLSMTNFVNTGFPYSIQNFPRSLE